MQTRFALITLENTVYGVTKKVLVCYFNKRWTAVRFDSPRLSTQVTPNNAGLSENRTVSLLTERGGFGRIDNPDKPFVEIAMLLKRYVSFDRNHELSHPSQIAVIGTEELSWASLTTVLVGNGALWDAVVSTFTRLFTSAGHPLMRVHAAITNMRVRLLNKAHPETRGAYTGELSVTPGVMYRNVFYHPFQAQQLETMQSLFRTLGDTARRCIAAHRRGHDWDGLGEEFVEMLTDSSTHELLYSQPRQRLTTMLSEKLYFLDVVPADCDHFETRDMLHSVRVDGHMRHWCDFCHSNHAVHVVDVNEYWDRDSAYYSEDDDAYYSHPQEHDDPAYEDGARAIMEYSTNVTNVLAADANIRSSPFGEFLMGIELELTTNGASRNLSAKAIRKSLGREYCVIKNDGSLPEDGIEVVTAPRGLKEHIDRFTAWEIDPRFRAWDTNQCGLHVHVHSRAFTEMTLGKFLMFINLPDNAPFLRKIAGRHPLKDTWAARYCAHESAEVLENPKAAIKGKSVERYRMVNVQNLSRGEAERLGLDPYRFSGKYDTIELRVFKASLMKERLLAQIEFSHAAVMFCRVASYRDLTGKTFLQWLQPNAALYPHLANWYGSRASKALKDLRVKSMEEACADKVVGNMDVPPRAVRATRPRRPLTNINQYLTPRARAEARERELAELIRRGEEELRAVRARHAAVLATPTI